jgi:pimeloyl-ACP methyl ester carboxylesterase
MDALGIEQAHLVGHSWGGDAALHFALLYPHRVAKVVVIEAGLIAALAHLYRHEDWAGWAYWAQILEQLTGVKVSPEKRNNLEYLLEQIIKVPIVYGPAKGQPRQEELVVRAWSILSATWNGHDHKEGSNISVESLAKILHPILLIYETSSIVIGTYEVLRDHLPNCSSILLPEGKMKHYTTLEHPELVLERLRTFLQLDSIRAAAVPEDSNND